MTPLTPKTSALIEKIFSADAIPAVKRILEDECGQNLPFCKDGSPESLERIRFAALKVSTSNIDKLREAISLAKIDWRDLLMWAEFGSNLEGHTKWAGKILSGSQKK